MRPIRNGNKALQEAHRGGKLCPHPQVPPPSLLTAATLGWWASPQRSDAGLRGRCSRPPEPSVPQKRLRGPSVHAETRCPVTELGRFSMRGSLAAGLPPILWVAVSLLSVRLCHCACGAVIKAPVPDPRS